MIIFSVTVQAGYSKVSPDVMEEQQLLYEQTDLIQRALHLSDVEQRGVECVNCKARHGATVTFITAASVL